MGRKDEYQSKLEFIDLNFFVPSNHILRQINEKIDFSFIYNKMEKQLYITPSIFEKFRGVTGTGIHVRLSPLLLSPDYCYSKTNNESAFITLTEVQKQCYLYSHLLLGVDSNGGTRKFLGWITLGYINQYPTMDCSYWLDKTSF
jgi:hypothetical protein